jgi:hypothetical protein
MTGCIPKIVMWTELAAFIAPPPAAIASRRSVASVMPMPPPPYCSGVVMPSHPWVARWS